jgi:hypothetical protein
MPAGTMMERRPHPGRQLIYVSTGVVLDIGGQLSRLPELPVGLTSEPRPRAVVEAQALATGPTPQLARSCRAMRI